MRRDVRHHALALAMTMLACGACKKSPAIEGEAGPLPQGLSAEQATQVLARVGERTITVGDYVAALEHMDQFDRLRYQAPERRKELLSEMIDVFLLADEARDKGYDKDTITQQEIREILRDAVLKKVSEGVPTPNEIPDGEVRAYYEAHRADFRDPERRRVSAIVGATAAAAASALTAARNATPSQWGELVRSRSIDPLARADVPVDLAGDLGFVSPVGDARGSDPRVPEPVREAAFQLAEVGDVLPRVVPAGSKFYVVKLTGKTAAHERTLEDTERMIRVKLAQEKLRSTQAAFIESLRSEFPVEIDEAALAEVKADVPGLDAGRAPR
ncbi:MAG: peptidylprolyl isomerase [Myxococcota bacterium]|nr:peptidylprolyl isomerase [Myxococcota bacterium]